MDRFLGGYRSLLAGVACVERAIVVFMLAAIVACIFAQVVSRYVFSQPLVWVEELSTYGFIWGTFIGASAGLKQTRHIKILAFVSRLPTGPRLTVRALTDVAIGLFCIILVLQGVRAMTLFEWRQRTIALPVELPRFLFYSTPLILGGASMVLTVVHDLLVILLPRAP